jgi:glycosyltransferase involved in cell wall biosynthesis
MKPFLSVVMLSHNDSKTLPVALVELDRCLSGAEHSYEIVVVDDGSRDGTPGIVDRLKTVVKNLKLVSGKERRGRGWTMREGMQRSSGNYRFFADVRNPASVARFEEMIPRFKEGYDVIAGGKNTLLRRPEFMCLSEKAAVEAGSALKKNGWLFDIEFMRLAKRLNFKMLKINA